MADGVLSGFLYDRREARAVGQPPSGHARGGASTAPVIGPSNLVLRAGTESFAALCSEAPRTIVVSRFSGSTEPTTGDFSGVVKGGFLVQRGERRPINETLIAGNLYELLQRITGISREVRVLGGSDRIPGLRFDDVAITAG